MKEQQIQSKRIKQLETEGYYVINLITTMENWKTIKDYDNYEISNCGNVKSLSRKVKCNNGFRTTKEKILKPKQRQK